LQLIFTPENKNRLRRTGVKLSMRTRIFILLVLLLASDFTRSQNREERKELIIMVEERQKMFDQYQASLKAKSGIFGHKTRNDLHKTHDRLKAIVEVDNRIMTRLRQMLEYRNFERQTMTYDVNRYAEQLKNYEKNQDTLLKQLSELEKQYDKLSKRSAGDKKWYWFLLGFISALLIILFIKRRRVYRSGTESGHKIT